MASAKNMNENTLKEYKKFRFHISLKEQLAKRKNILENEKQ